MAKTLFYHDLKTPGHGWLEEIICEDPMNCYYVTPCVWLDENAFMINASSYTYFDEDECQYKVIQRNGHECGVIPKDSLVAWRVWDSEPTENEMLSEPWISEHSLIQPCLIYRENIAGVLKVRSYHEN